VEGLNEELFVGLEVIKRFPDHSDPASTALPKIDVGSIGMYVCTGRGGSVSKVLC
jgi:hypothetical protein